MDRVSPGGSITKPSASFHNLLVEMVEEYKARRSPASNILQPRGNVIDSATEILAIRDGTADDLAQFSPVVLKWDTGTTGLGADPIAVGPAAYMLRPVARAISPTGGDAAEMIGIAADNILKGKTGRVYVSGVCLAYVQFTDITHNFAVLGSAADALNSAASGPVKILWRYSSDITAPVLCKVLLNCGGADSTAMPYKTVHLMDTTGGVVARTVEITVDGWQETDPVYEYENVREAQGLEFLQVDPSETANFGIPLFFDSNGQPYVMFGGICTRVMIDWACVNGVPMNSHRTVMVAGSPCDPVELTSG